MKLFAGIYYRSAWLVLLGIYYILFVVMRVFLLAFARGEKEAGRNQPLEWRKYCHCGVMLLFMNQVLTGIVIYAMHQNKSFDYPGALIYMMALYSFYAVIMSVRNVVKVRKYASPVMADARVVNTMAAIVSMYSLKTAMLSRPGEDMAFRRALLSATGGWVCPIWQRTQK